MLARKTYNRAFDSAVFAKSLAKQNAPTDSAIFFVPSWTVPAQFTSLGSIRERFEVLCFQRNKKWASAAGALFDCFFIHCD